jgi:hypothetical protein
MGADELTAEPQPDQPEAPPDLRKRRFFFHRILFMKVSIFIDKYILGHDPRVIHADPPGLPPLTIKPELQPGTCPVCRGEGGFDEELTIHPKCLTCDGSGKY